MLAESVVYDSRQKVWKSTVIPDKDLTNRSVGEAFLSTMRKVNKEKILDYFYDKNISKTAKEIYKESIKIALNLQRLNVVKNDVIVIFALSNEWTSVLAMGSILAGGQINFFEVNLSDNDVDTTLRILQPSVILYEEEYLSKIQQSLKRQPLNTLKHIISIDGSSDMTISKELLNDNRLSTIDFDSFKAVRCERPDLEVCCLIFTSGSTGIPKVVKQSHSQILRTSLSSQFLPEDFSCMSFSPIRWGGPIIMLFNSMIWAVKRISCNGLLSASYAKTVLQQCDISILLCVPSFFNDILMELDANDTETLKSLMVVVLTGETPGAHLQDLLKKHNPETMYAVVYGMTETCGGIASIENNNGGILGTGYELCILDDNQLPVGPNICGQLAVKPYFPFLGYKGMDNSKLVFNKDFFITGDYGFMDEACRLHVLERCKYLVKTQRATLIPSKVEFPILELPEVRAACLVGYTKSAKDLYQTGALFIVLEKNTDVDKMQMNLVILKKLQSFLSAEQISGIRDVNYILQLPLTTCGKTDRDRLQMKALELSLSVKAYRSQL